MSYFKQLGLSKGYKITYHTDLFQEYEDVEDKLKFDKITPIINAKDCTQEEFNLLLLKQKQNIATEEDIIRTTKQMYKTNLGVDILTEPLMKNFYRKKHTVKNFIQLIDAEAEICTDTQHGEEKRIKLEIVRKIITLLGWKNGTDDKVISKDEFDLGMINLIGKSEIFTNQKMVKIYFEMSKSKIDTSNSKFAIKYINEFLKHYSLKVEVFYEGNRIDKNKRLKLTELHNVSEIVEYLVKAKRFKPFHGMRKPEKYVYNDCISKEKASGVHYEDAITLDFE
jgi:hypothetical protein